jgi:hypothetical protein
MRRIGSVAAKDGKKADDGMMISLPDSQLITLADPADAQTLTPATTTEGSDIPLSRCHFLWDS